MIKLLDLGNSVPACDEQTKQPPEGGCLSWGLKIRLT